jgi:uncharacterized protein YgbK (DUF1537 family)
MALILGCIADDMTGATDLALMLANNGMPVIQYIGIPDIATPLLDAAAAVVGLKTRSCPPQSAVHQSLATARWLRKQGAQQLFFKYCSTFDSTPAGNIGPVGEALLDETGGKLALVCPAFPANQRSVYMGHLFVGEQLLSDSGMRDHPVTPMTDANLQRLLQPQLRHDSKVGLISHAIVSQGPAAVKTELKRLIGEGVRFVVADAIANADLFVLGEAAADLALVTGGSGVAMGLPENFRRKGLLEQASGFIDISGSLGPAAVLSGSCSLMTQSQVSKTRRIWPALQLDPLAISRGTQSVDSILEWASSQIGDHPFLIYSTADANCVANIQNEIGRQESMELIERTLARVAAGLVTKGVRKLVVAGGETSGAVIQELGIKALRIGPQIAPGVPWTRSEPDGLLLALKSGNFGDEDFFAKAVELVA